MIKLNALPKALSIDSKIYIYFESYAIFEHYVSLRDKNGEVVATLRHEHAEEFIAIINQEGE